MSRTWRQTPQPRPVAKRRPDWLTRAVAQRGLGRNSSFAGAAGHHGQAPAHPVLPGAHVRRRRARLRIRQQGRRARQRRSAQAGLLGRSLDDRPRRVQLRQQRQRPRRRADTRQRRAQLSGMDGSDAFDFSSVYFGQNFGDAVSLVFGKMNMIDVVSGKPFMGGAGIDSFWNLSFVAPPTGTVPAYMFGVLMSVRTEEATYRLWVYDPNSGVNKGFNDTFDGGVTVRGSVEFPVTIAGRRGSSGLHRALQHPERHRPREHRRHPSPVADSRNRRGQEFALLLRLFVRPVSPPGRREPGRRRRSLRTGGNFGWQSEHDALVDPGRPGRQGDGSRAAEDNWGIGYYYDGISHYLKDALAPAVTLHERAGRRALLQLRADPVVRAGRGPAGHQARPRQRHRRDSGRSCGDQVLSAAVSSSEKFDAEQSRGSAASHVSKNVKCAARNAQRRRGR